MPWQLKILKHATTDSTAVSGGNLGFAIMYLCCNMNYIDFNHSVVIHCIQLLFMHTIIVHVYMYGV